MTAQVFVSQDPAEAAAYVDGLCRYLAAHGIPAWYEREIGGDQRWAQVVEQIRACSAVVVVMTPGAERSPWVSSQVTFAQQLGKPILPLLLGGTVFPSLAELRSENVTTGAMPSAAFVTRLRSFLPYQPAPAPGEQTVGAPPAPPARRAGIVVGIVAAAVVGILVLVCVTGVIYFRIGSGTAAGSTTPRTWQDRAAAIPGMHDYLVTNPEWFVVGPDGNHRRGVISYPISPPVGGLHNPTWQNCMGDVYDAPVAQEHVMHNLEHGAVWVTYRPDLAKSDIDKLAGKVRGTPFLLMSPYPGLETHAATFVPVGTCSS